VRVKYCRLMLQQYLRDAEVRFSWGHTVIGLLVFGVPSGFICPKMSSKSLKKCWPKNSQCQQRGQMVHLTTWGAPDCNRLADAARPSAATLHSEEETSNQIRSTSNHSSPGVFLSFYLILMWLPLRIFWLNNRPRVQAGAQADCAAHAIAGSGWKKTANV